MTRRQVIDLRSDTVTRPTPQMRQFMASAEVGDDCYREDPTVNQLEAEVADLFGKQAALFVPSGTMANQICLRLLVPPGGELWCESNAHILLYEHGAAARYGGITTTTLDGERGAIRAIDVQARLLQRRAAQYPSAVAVEVTHNRSGGAVPPLGSLHELRQTALTHGMAVHCDGARIWHAAEAAGVGLAEYGELFDTIAVCASKGLGAPVGSLLVTTAERAEQARQIRKSLGGGMRQAGIVAAGALYAIRHHRARLAVDHARAARLAAALVPYCDPAQVETNMVLVRTGLPAEETARLVKAAGAKGVRVGHLAGDTLRLVTHLDMDDEAIEVAGSVLSRLLAAAGASGVTGTRN